MKRFSQVVALPLLATLFAPPSAAQGIKLNGPIPTSPVGDAFSSAFDASGERVFYFAEQHEDAELFSVPADRSSSPVRIDAGAGTLVPTPDGTRMVYQVVRDGVRNLRSVPVDGSAPPVTLHGPVASSVSFAFAVSPDSQRVVHRVGTQLLSRRVDGSAPSATLASGVTQHWITGDSEHVVFLGTGSGLFSVPIDGSSAPLRLDLGGFPHNNVRNLKITEDGSTVVFTANTSGGTSVFAVPVDGSTPPNVLSGNDADGNGEDFVLSPDGEWVFFQAGDEVQSAPIDGSGPARALSTPLNGNGSVSRVTVSPDSSTALWTADRLGLRESVFAAPIDGSAPALRVNQNGEFVHAFFVSPDSAWVVFESHADSVADVHLRSRPIDLSEPSRELSGASVAGGAVEENEARITPDSAWVVYRADHDTDEVRELYAVPIDGHLPRAKLNGPLVAGGSVGTAFSTLDALVSMSPDGSRVVYRADQLVDGVDELFVTPLPPGGAAVRVNDPLYQMPIGDVLGFAFAPAGDRVVYRSTEDTPGTSELFSVRLGTLERTKVNGPLVAGGNVQGFVLAGERCVFRADADVDSQAELYGTPIDGGSPPVQLNAPLAASEDVTNFAISSDGTSAVFIVGNSLFSAGTDGAEAPVQLDDSLVTPTGEFAISPDGTRVAYRGRDDASLVVGLYGVPVGGGTSVELVAPLSDQIFPPVYAISSDSEYAVSLSSVAGVESLWSARIDGSGEATQLNGPLVANGDVDAFRISPTSQRVIYRADEETDFVDELYSVPIDGLTSRVKLNPAMVAGGEVQAFEVSADGAWVVYLADQAIDEVYELFTVPIDGSAAPIRLHLPLSGGVDVTGFALAPDGSSVAIRVRLPSGLELLFVAPVDGSGAPLQLSSSSNPTGNIESFAISPDSQWAVYHGDLRVEGVKELFCAPVDGSLPQRRVSGPLVDGGDVTAFQVAGGSLVAYLANQDEVNAVELYLGFLQPPGKLARRKAPASEASFDF